MTIQNISSGAVRVGTNQGPSENFSKTFEKVQRPEKATAQPSMAVVSAHAHAVQGATGVSSEGVRQVVGNVLDAQKRMDEVMALAEKGKSFTPAELLSLQAQVYQSSQTLDLAGKVVEKVSGGVKQILQTQL